MSYDEIRPIFEKEWKFNQDFLAEKPEEEQEQEQVEKAKDTVKPVEEEDKTVEIEQEVSRKSVRKRRKLLTRKRTIDAQGKDTSKRQKRDNGESKDPDDEDITQYIVLADVEEIAIDAIPLATKPLRIVDVEVESERQMSSYCIKRADGNSRKYRTMTHIPQQINREDLKNLWKIVKEKFKNAGLKDTYKRVLREDLRVMFELEMESEIWTMIEHYDVTGWFLYSSCGVYLIQFDGLHMFLLVDKIYPLPYATITKMLERKLQGEQNEIGYQLIKLMLKLQQQKK
ncbi:hypothetical protein Tco_1404678 [Tanacetum coccineum]